MADAQLVPDVRILDSEVGNNEVGDQQFLKHVREDVARTRFLVRAKYRESRAFDSRLDEVVEDAVEVDGLPVRSRLRPERHRNESVGPHAHSFWSSRKCKCRTVHEQSTT